LKIDDDDDDDDMHINTACKSVRENMKGSARVSRLLLSETA